MKENIVIEKAHQNKQKHIFSVPKVNFNTSASNANVLFFSLFIYLINADFVIFNAKLKVSVLAP